MKRSLRKHQGAALSAAKSRGRSLRRRLFEAQRGRCYLCGRGMPPLDDAAERANLVTLEHIRPQAKGGRSKRGNVALAHSRCNTQKADRPPTACEVLFGTIVDQIMRTEPVRRPRRWVKPFELYGR